MCQHIGNSVLCQVRIHSVENTLHALWDCPIAANNWRRLQPPLPWYDFIGAKSDATGWINRNIAIQEACSWGVN